jgi:hypothetical protein
MNVYKTVKSNLILYPGLFPNAFYVYEHLFCTSGNGFDWKNGQLCDYYDEEFSIEDSVISLIDNTIAYTPYNLVFLGNDKDLKKGAKSILGELRENIENAFSWKSKMFDFSFPENYKIMYLSKYSSLCNLPDDIQEDWLQAAKKMYKILINNRDKIDDREGWLDKIGPRIETLIEKRTKYGKIK